MSLLLEHAIWPKPLFADSFTHVRHSQFPPAVVKSLIPIPTVHYAAVLSEMGRLYVWDEENVTETIRQRTGGEAHRPG